MAAQFYCFILGTVGPLAIMGWLIIHLECVMTTLANQPAAAGIDPNAPSLRVATLGFLGSTFLTATVMVLLSAL
jgi:hypothetical protein